MSIHTTDYPRTDAALSRNAIGRATAHGLGCLFFDCGMAVGTREERPAG